MLDLSQLREFLVIFGLSVIRMTAACSVAPFLSTQMVPGRVRSSIIFSWGLMVYPIVSPALTAPDSALELTSLAVLIGLITKEVVLGILLGFIAAKMFWVAMSVGFFIDNQRGASMASTFDPMAGEQTSPTGQMLLQAFTVLFYTSGGLLLFLGGLFQSYAIWPIDTFYPTFSATFPEFILSIGDDIMRLMIVLVAPVAITVFVTEFGLGLVNRFAPQLNVFFLAMPVKSIVGMFVLVLYLPFLLTHFNRQFAGGDAMIEFFRAFVE